MIITTFTLVSLAVAIVFYFVGRHTKAGGLGLVSAD